MIRWGRPEWLWLLPVWAVGAGAAFAALRRRERRLAELIDPALWPQLMPGRSARAPRRRLLAWTAAMGLIAVALARPQWGERREEVRRRGLQIVVALDTSNSMLATDLKPSRLQQAKWGLRDMVGRLRGDRIALVAFAGAAFVQCPMTIDYAAFLMTLDDIYAGIVPRGGTDIPNAVRTALQAFDYETGGDRALVLVTDGENHAGDVSAVAAEVRRRGVHLFVVGVGTPDGELIPQSSGGFLKDRDGNVVKTRLREDSLVSLAAAAGGVYTRAAPGDIGLDRVVEEGIDRLQREAQESRVATVAEERAGWFLAAALLLLLGEALGVARWPPRTAAAAALVALASAAGAADPSPRDTMAEGLRLLRDQRYAEAAAAFDAAAAAAPAERLDPARARYNQALALLSEEGREDEAEVASEQALRTTDREVLARTLYNRGWRHARRAMAEREAQRLPQAQTNAAQAVSSFENALLLTPEDDDARLNYEMSRELLEEIRRHMEASPQPQPSSSPETTSQPQNQEDPTSPSESSPDTPSPPAEPTAQQPDQLNSRSADESPAAEPPPAAAGGETREKNERMTPEEAAMLLDAMKAEEQAARMRLQQRSAPPLQVDKDW